MFCDLLLRPRAIGAILSGHEALTPGDPEVKTEAKDRDPNVLLPDGTQLSDRPSHLFLRKVLLRTCVGTFKPADGVQITAAQLEMYTYLVLSTFSSIELRRYADVGYVTIFREK